jgi:hypothetical protein
VTALSRQIESSHVASDASTVPDVEHATLKEITAVARLAQVATHTTSIDHEKLQRETTLATAMEQD